MINFAGVLNTSTIYIFY